MKVLEKNPKRISKSEPYIGQYDWKYMNLPAGSKSCKHIETNNKTIALIFFFINRRWARKNKTSLHLKTKSYREHQIILAIIRGGEKWHYLPVKSLTRLLYRITSNHGH